jgi:pSer/pThr/pTyr-binding forkhead associated (FHA) protein
MEEFRAACEMTTPLELGIQREGAAMLRAVITQPFLVIGRDPQADLRLNNTAVSIRHAYLQVIAGHVFFLDLGSRTRTLWEDTPIKSCWFCNGEVLRIGPYQVHLLQGGQDEEPSLASPLSRGSAAAPPGYVEFVNSSRAEPPFLLHRGLTLVGRAPNCKLRLGDVSVSRVHCCLLCTPVGIWVVDLLGRDGTLVNGTAVRYAPLQDQDLLKIGKFLLRVRYGMPELPVSELLLPASRTGRTDPAREMSVRPNSAGSGNSLALPGSVPSANRSGLIGPAQGQPLLESVLAPLVAQFGQMQQQMFDQFQQTVLMMGKMFHSLHRDQAQLIRQELEQLNELTQELCRLQGQMQTQAPAEQPLLPAPQAKSPPESARNKPAKPATRKAPRQTRTAPPAPKKPPAAPSREPVASAPPTDEQLSPPEGLTGDEVHAWLCSRIETVQRDRQRLWQKIVGFLMGKPPSTTSS